MVMRAVRSIDGRARAGFVIFGGMIALQSSQEIDVWKLAYLVGATLALAGTALAIWRRRDEPDVRGARSWLVGSAGLVGLVAVSFLVARANGTALTPWLRDSITYLLVATVPLFALDLGASASRETIVRMLLVAGLLGGLSWAVEWLNRRDIIELPLTRLLFPSPQLPAMLYMFAFASAVHARRAGLAWGLLAGLVFGLFLVTGTRSSLLFLAGPLAIAAIAAFAGRTYLTSAARWAIVQGAAAVGVVLLFQVTLAAVIPPPSQPPPAATGSGAPTVSAPPARPDVIGTRWGSLPGLLDQPARDDSISERVAQYRATAALIAASPLLGKGPGLAIDWTDISGFARSAFTADTPLVFPAKFGLLGVVALFPLLVAYLGLLRRLLRLPDRPSVVGLTLAGYAAASIAALPLGFLLEDKGTSLALILVLGLAFNELRSARATDGAARADVAPVGG
jgi:hypothetical protein